MTPYKTQNLVYEWVDFSQFSQIWAKIGSNLRKFLKNRAILLKIWENLVQNWADWYINGSLFLEKLVFVWVYFQISRRHIPTKTKVEYPPPGELDGHYILIMEWYLQVKHCKTYISCLLAVLLRFTFIKRKVISKCGTSTYTDN